jgi:hypothetical protein
METKIVELKNCLLNCTKTFTLSLMIVGCLPSKVDSGKSSLMTGANPSQQEIIENCGKSLKKATTEVEFYLCRIGEYRAYEKISDLIQKAGIEVSEIRKLISKISLSNRGGLGLAGLQTDEEKAAEMEEYEMRVRELEFRGREVEVEGKELANRLKAIGANDDHLDRVADLEKIH